MIPELPKSTKTKTQKVTTEKKRAAAEPKLDSSKDVDCQPDFHRPTPEFDAEVSNVSEGADNDFSKKQRSAPVVPMSVLQTNTASSLSSQVTSDGDNYSTDFEEYSDVNVDWPIISPSVVATKRKSPPNAGDSRSAKRSNTTYVSTSPNFLPLEQNVVPKPPLSPAEWPVRLTEVLGTSSTSHLSSSPHTSALLPATFDTGDETNKLDRDDHSRQFDHDEALVGPRVYRPLPKRSSRGSDHSLLNSFLNNPHQSKPGPVSRRTKKRADTGVSDPRKSTPQGKGKQKA